MTPQLAVEPGTPLGQGIVLGIGERHPTMTVLRPELSQLMEPLVEFLVLALRHVQPVDLGMLPLAKVQLELDGLELPDPLVGEGRRSGLLPNFPLLPLLANPCDEINK
jgi:hypothetical protein